jgi:hypothetical protein
MLAMELAEKERVVQENQELKETLIQGLHNQGQYELLKQEQELPEEELLDARALQKRNSVEG